MAKNQTIESLQAALETFRAEHRRVGDTVEKLEALLAGLTDKPAGKRRGRPPGKKGAPKLSLSTTQEKALSTGKKGRKKWTPKQKKEAGERMRAMWAAKKKA